VTLNLGQFLISQRVLFIVNSQKYYSSLSRIKLKELLHSSKSINFDKITFLRCFITINDQKIVFLITYIQE
jgi:hypothetical protein